MGSNNCFSTIIANIFPSWHCVYIHLNAPDQQTAKTLAFIEMDTLADDHFKIFREHLLEIEFCKSSMELWEG